MLRWIVACCAALLLSGCVTYPTYTYDDGREVRYVDDETYYVGAGNGYGDYYASEDPWRHSAYYSVFWPIHRLYWDSYWYPGFYYGITYFPRDYFHIGWGSGWHPYSGYWHWYAPYRYSWTDNYYAWDWHRGRHSVATTSAPRFGHARNEAERLNWYAQGSSAPRASRNGISSGAAEQRDAAAGNVRPSRAASYGGYSPIDRNTARPVQSNGFSTPPARVASPASVISRPATREAAPQQRSTYLPAPVTRSRVGSDTRARPAESFDLPQAAPRRTSPGRSAQMERSPFRQDSPVSPFGGAGESGGGATRPSGRGGQDAAPMRSPSPRMEAPRAEPVFRSEPSRASSPVSRGDSPARGAARAASRAGDEQ